MICFARRNTPDQRCLNPTAIAPLRMAKWLTPSEKRYNTIVENEPPAIKKAPENTAYLYVEKRRHTAFLGANKIIGYKKTGVPDVAEVSRASCRHRTRQHAHMVGYRVSVIRNR